MPRKSKSSSPASRPMTGPQRLNKILAAAGLGSRRQVEEYITDGRIEVDGQPVTDLATKVDPEATKITFDGSQVKIFRPVYFALNKPTGVLSTNRDPSGRMRAIDLVNVKERIFSAGRLDRSSEGLMLLTNDGELVQRLSHPRYGVQKLYLATVQGEITQVDLEKLIRGVRLAEGYAKVDAVKVRKQRSGSADLEIALSEGKNREIRRILARLGHKVVGLKRLAIGPLRLGQLPTGGWRPVSRNEVEALYAAATSGRRKRRGTAKPIGRRSTISESEQPSILSAGQFDEFFSDDMDDMPSLLDQDDDADIGGDSEDFVSVTVGDHSTVGTVLGYEEEDETADEPSRRGPPRRPAKKGAPKRPYSSSRASSPNDLRNRRPSSSSTGVSRSGYSKAGASRSNAPRSGAPRPGSSKTSGPAKGGYRKDGDRSRSGPGAKSGPKRGFKSSPGRGPKASGAGPKAGGPKSAPRRNIKKRGRR